MTNKPTDKTVSNKLLTLAAGIAVLAAADQLTKVWAVRALKDAPHVLIDGVLEFCYLENHGAAFGVFQGARSFFLIITVAFLIAASCVFCRIPSTRRMVWLRLTLILMTGGAVGNFIDRMRFGYVRDFIYFSLIDFPIFNVADICVTTSAILLAFLVLFVYKENDLAFLSRKRDVDKTINE